MAQQELTGCILHTQTRKGQPSPEAPEILCQPLQPHRGERLPSLPRVLRSYWSEKNTEMLKRLSPAIQLAEAEARGEAPTKFTLHGTVMSQRNRQQATVEGRTLSHSSGLLELPHGAPAHNRQTWELQPSENAQVTGDSCDPALPTRS